jgi:alkylhydroperoxidase family enzyme
MSREDAMTMFARFRSYVRVMRTAKRPLETVRLLRGRWAIFGGVTAYELALFASNRVEARLKTLAQVKASALVGCPA